MTHLRTYVAMTATAAALALGQNASAQDDLNDLLAEFGDKPAAQAAKKDEAKAVAFDNKNDVIAYLTEQGEKFATEEELADLMRKYNIKLAE